MPKFPSYIVLIILAAFLHACDEHRVFEENQDFKSQEWISSDTIEFSTLIEDSGSKNLYINVRHRFNFNWRNVWLNLAITFPNDSLYITPINIPLSQPDGQWFGDCSGDICALQFPLSAYSNYTFPDTGNYTFNISHDMREDPLLNVMSIGMRIENYTSEE